MSCPVWDLPELDRERWDLDSLCGLMACSTCTAEPGDMPWLPDAPEQDGLEGRREKRDGEQA